MYPILLIITFLPLLGGIAILFIPKQYVGAMRWTAFAVACVNVFQALALMLTYSQANPTTASPVIGSAPNGTFLYSELIPWIPSLGINYSLGVDGISLLLVVLTTLLTLVCIGASFRVEQKVKNYTAFKFVLYTSVGSLLMLAGIIAVGYYHRLAAGGACSYTLDLATLLNTASTCSGTINTTVQIWLFLAFAAAFVVKVPFIPFHSWLPDAYSEAPAPVTAMLAGAMSKTGAYGFLRFCLPLFPSAAHTLAPLFNSLAVAGILYCAVLALVQTDLKRLLAYSSISHLGIVMLGMFAFNAQGIEGSVLQMVNHGITIAALFLIVGFIETRTGTRNINDFGGIAGRVPVLATVMLIAALSSLGLPGLNNFAGEFLTLLGVFRANAVFGVLGTLVIIPAAWYLIRFFLEVMEGPGQKEGVVSSLERKGKLYDLQFSEFLPLAPLLLLIFYIGIQPAPLTFLMEPSVVNTLQNLSSAFIR